MNLEELEETRKSVPSRRGLRESVEWLKADKKRWGGALGIFIVGVSLAVMGGAMLNHGDRKDPHRELRSAVKAMELAGDLERFLERKQFEKAIEPVEKMCELYRVTVNSETKSGNFAARHYNEKAVKARESLFHSLRFMRFFLWQVKDKRFTMKREAELRFKLDDFLNAAQVLAFARYEPTSEFYVPPNRKLLMAARKELRKLSQRSPEQTRYAIDGMNKSLLQLLKDSKKRVVRKIKDGGYR